MELGFEPHENKKGLKNQKYADKRWGGGYATKCMSTVHDHLIVNVCFQISRICVF